MSCSVTLFFVDLERVLILFLACVCYLCWIAVSLVSLCNLFLCLLPCVSCRFVLVLDMLPGVPIRMWR